MKFSMFKTDVSKTFPTQHRQVLLRHLRKISNVEDNDLQYQIFIQTLFFIYSMCVWKFLRATCMLETTEAISVKIDWIPVWGAPFLLMPLKVFIYPDSDLRKCGIKGQISPQVISAKQSVKETRRVTSTETTPPRLSWKVCWSEWE